MKIEICDICGVEGRDKSFYNSFVRLYDTGTGINSVYNYKFFGNDTINHICPMCARYLNHKATQAIVEAAAELKAKVSEPEPEQPEVPQTKWQTFLDWFKK